MSEESKTSKKKRGLFIVIEGLDRCGKTTQVKKLIDKIGHENAIEKCFPDRETAIGKLIDKVLKKENVDGGDINNEALHLLFSANRWEKNDEIKKIIFEEKLDVVCSRYYYSGAAYSMAKGLEYEWCVAPEDGLLVPDIVIHMRTMSVDVLSKRGGYGDELFETKDFQSKVKESFDILFENEEKKWKVMSDNGKKVPYYLRMNCGENDKDITIDITSIVFFDTYQKIKDAIQ